MSVFSLGVTANSYTLSIVVAETDVLSFNAGFSLCNWGVWDGRGAGEDDHGEMWIRWYALTTSLCTLSSMSFADASEKKNKPRLVPFCVCVCGG